MGRSYHLVEVGFLIALMLIVGSCRGRLLEEGGRMGSLECKDGVLVCEEECFSMGCFFTCIDDVGFFCLCHCEPKIENQLHLVAFS